MTTRKLMSGKTLAKLAMSGMVIGTIGLTGCKHTASPESSDNSAALAKFIADCQTDSGTVINHDSCNGTGSCKGTSYDVTKGSSVTHDCAGKNTCAGATCQPKEPSALQKFAQECEAAGKVVEYNSCNGQSSCAGMSINENTGATETHTCSGHNTCAGARCVG